MALSRAQLWLRNDARDGRYNRRFIIAVKTTRIYCVPSCPAPRPKLENIEFLDSPEEAKSKGFRACKRCFPDLAFYGLDPAETLLDNLVADVRAKPADFASVEAMARHGGISVSRLHADTRRHYHATPLDILTDARVEAAKRLLLESDRPVAEVGLDVGFDNPSVLYDNFGRATGMAPGEYRTLRDATSFRLKLPQPYPTHLLLRYLKRDPEDPLLHANGSTFQLATPKGVACFEVGPDAVEASGWEPGEGAALHAAVARLTGLTQDPRAFETMVRGRARFAGLIAGREGLRVFQSHDVLDAIVWAIVGQQITVSFAMKVRRRLFEKVGDEVKPGLYRRLTLDRLAAIDPPTLIPLQFSARKAEYVVGIAQRFLDEGLDPESLATGSATKTERWLMGVRGFGAWSTNYVMMRGCGFSNCMPTGDTALAAALVRALDLPARPALAEFEELMKPLEPYRSLATFQLWHTGHVQG